MEVKVLRFKEERSLPDCYTMIDNNFQMDVEGEVGYRYVCIRESTYKYYSELLM
jgi:hypothetical protein